jgi:hypothetical protein
MKTFARLITVLLLSVLVAAGAEYALGIHPAITFTGMMGLSILQSVVPMPQGVSFMAIQTELWTGELIKNFRHEHMFLSRISNRNQYVNKNAIHMVDIGADPAVLVNNTTYPINSAQRTDSDIVISLDKFDTENTIITDDELYALPYDKPGSVIEQHRAVLEEKTAEKAVHSLCPVADSADTPVVMTTGNSNGLTNARKRLTINDIVRAKKLLDDLKVPLTGRELVLCNQHVEDLLITSQAFKDQWYKAESGQIFNMFGFIISQFVANPLFSNATGQKKAFGAALDPADDLQTSVFYYNKRAVQARGTAKMYFADAKNDPKYRQSEVGFTLYHICLPKKNTGFGAIVSDVVA